MNRQYLLLIFSILLVCGKVWAVGTTNTFQVQHQKPAFVERKSPFELAFTVPGIDARQVEDAFIFYRVTGDMGYSRKQASLVASRFKAQLSVEDQQATELEYYLEVHLNSGERITYPQNEASSEPIRIEVVDQHKNERQRRVEQTGVDYTILSPNPGSTVSQKDVVIALTLFYNPAEIDTANSSFRMLVDGRNVTDVANASAYFYTYSIDNLPGGAHSASFQLEKPDTVLTVVDWEFNVLDPNSRIGAPASGGDGWMPKGNIELSARNQRVGGYSNDALSGNVRLSGQKGNISYSAYGLLTTQEDPRLQPQNRFGASLYVDDWLELEAGHVYPTLNALTIAGQRMQGVNAGFHAWEDALNLRFIYGKLRRGIDNLYDLIEAEEQTFDETQEPVTSYSLNTREGGAGTFERKVMGGRLGAGRGKTFNFGVNFLKVEDDTNSIRLINDFRDADPTLARDLTALQKQELQNNPEQLSINGNPAPKGNFVAASDLEARFDNNRIEFQADAAVSLLNQDISEGVLSREAAEDMGLSIDNDTENLLDRLSWLIIINENMDTLPIRFDTGIEEAAAEAFFPTSILATQSELGLNYLDNNLRVRYRWVGPGYNSLANTTVRKDVAGFSISDRLQLLQNRVYLTLNYERLHDNVAGSKDATTNTTTYRGNISWYPVDQDLPRLSLGLMKRNRDNGVALYNPFVKSTEEISENTAVQNFVIKDGQPILGANPRKANTYQFTASVTQQFSLFGVANDASLSYSLLNTMDEVFKYGDAQSNSFSMQVINRFDELPLQTNLGFNLNNTQTASGLTDIQIVGANVGGSVFLFDDKLSLDTSLAFTKNRSQTTTLTVADNGTPQQADDDYYRPGGNAETSMAESNAYIVSTGARYNLNAQHAFQLTFRYSNVRNTLSSASIPNDHLLRARYIFNF